MSSFVDSLIFNNSLKRLNIDGNGLASVWGVAIAEALAKNSTIENFSIRNNRLDSRAGKALYNTYKHNYHLQQLAVSSEEVGQDIFDLFAALYTSRCSVSHPDDVKDETLFYYKSERHSL
jgi:hypothetical protein